MEGNAVRILHDNKIMAISTLRPDGWPQTTLVSYANDGLLIYFNVSRSSQKFVNLQQDDRVSIAIGHDFFDPSTIRALSISGRASEVRDSQQRSNALDMLLERHPGLRRLETPSPETSAVMRINPEHVSILDYSKGFGHADELTVSPGGVLMNPARDDDWGFGNELKPLA